MTTNNEEEMINQNNLKHQTLNSDFTELLNTLTYTNYGKFLNSNCIDLSNSNRFALATDKCIFILNLNLDWPSLIKNSSPFKFFNSANTNSNTKQANQPIQLDSWIRDLNETKNESFYINVIRNINHSNKIHELYKNFYQLEENQSNKRKSFNRQLKDVISKNKSACLEDEEQLNECSPSKLPRRSKQTTKSTAALNQENDINKFIDQNSEQYLIKKTNFDQSKIYDSFYYEYLSYLNPYLNQNQTLIDNYKYLKWSSNINLHLLATITTTNQLIIFDCTKLQINNQTNVPDKNNKPNDECITIFDSKTKSVSFNLTELWMIKHCKYSTTFKNNDDFILNINRIIPTSLCWSSSTITFDNTQFDLIFVSFKSNEIGVFAVFKDDSNYIKLKLIDSFNMKNIFENEQQDDDEIVDFNLFAYDLPKIQITSLSCKLDDSNGFALLSIGLSNGDVYINKFEIDRIKLMNLRNDSLKCELKLTFNPIKLKSICCFGSVEKIELIKLNLEEYLVIIQKENRLLFVIYNVNKLIQNNMVLNHHTNEKNHSKNNSPGLNNYLTKTFYKLIDFISIKNENNNELEFLLTFENSFIEYLNIVSDNGKLKINKNSLINDTNEIKFNTIEVNNAKLIKKESNVVSSQHVDSSQKMSLIQSSNNLFKMTKKILISSNKQILYQINDFSKAILIQKKPPDFHINIYRITSLNNLIENCLNSSANTNRELLNLNDYIWLFKRNLYLNHDSIFNQRTFNTLYSHLKQSNNLNTISIRNDDSKALLKRLRILCFYIESYYQISSSFDRVMKDKNLNEKVEESESDSEESDEEEDDDEKSSHDSQDPIEISPVKNDNIIKSSSYYKSMFRELTVSLFKNYSLNIISTAYMIGFNKLTNYERLVLLVMGELSINKNFLQNFNIDLYEKKSPAKSNTIQKCDGTEIEKWLKTNLVTSANKKSQKSNDNEKITNQTSLADLVKSLKCNFCPKNLDIHHSNDLDKIVCEGGHSISRCSKTLLPLNFINFIKCELCQSTWNCIDSKDCPNIKQLISNQELCIFCD